MSENPKTEPRRYDGHLPHVVEFIKKQPGQKSKLIDWITEHTEVQAELEKVYRLTESLPREIDELLQSGKMDNPTVEKLAKKRAHLDLLPAREEKLATRDEQLTGTEYHIASYQLELAVRRAQGVYIEVQMQEAAVGYKALGVDEATAREQIALRPDFKLLAEPIRWQFDEVGGQINTAKGILWCFEAFEAGFHPLAPDGLKFKEKWIPPKK